MISWADTERDLSAWLGNARQSNALAETYKLDLKKHPLWDHDLKAKEEHFYEALKRDLARHPPGDRLLWCADLPDVAEGPLYVDACHYSPKFARRIAEEIVRQADAKKLLLK